MKRFLSAYWKTLLFFGLAGLAGGFFTGLSVLESYSPDMQQQLLSSLPGTLPAGMPVNLFIGLVTAVQAAGYGIFLGAAGIVLGKKTGLWKDERRFERKPLRITLFIAFLGGLALILPDLLFFTKYSDMILQSYAQKPGIPYILGAVLYGGVIEEVMLRLFLLSLFAFLLHRLWGKKKETPSAGILIAANILSALLFAAGHLPATAAMTALTPMLVFRCFLLNGGFGLLFGYLYRKYGLRYAMLAHGGVHVVSKLIWILFI